MTTPNGVTGGDHASDGAGSATPPSLTSVETAEVYIGVCPEDINTGWGDNMGGRGRRRSRRRRKRRVIVHRNQDGGSVVMRDGRHFK